MENELAPKAVQSALSTSWMARRYRYYDTVGSTNDILAEMVAQGREDEPPEGTALLADFQSKGRGRMERVWIAPPGSSILTSVLFRPYWDADRAGWLTIVGALAVAEAVEQCTALSAAVKWPNDVVLNHRGVWHKVSGLLLQGEFSAEGKLASAILGIGINVNIKPDELPRAVTPPTSLLAVLGEPVSRLRLLTALYQRLEERYQAAASGVSPLGSWRDRLITLTHTVTVTHMGTDVTLYGVAEDVDDRGQLLVRDAKGKLHAVAAGDVTLQPLR